MLTCALVYMCGTEFLSAPFVCKVTAEVLNPGRCLRRGVLPTKIEAVDRPVRHIFIH